MPNDILIDELFDILFDGDFTIGESTEQHQETLLLASPGEIRSAPMAGVGLLGFLKEDSSTGDLLGKIKTEFEKDGMVVTKISLTGGKILANALYK